MELEALKRLAWKAEEENAPWFEEVCHTIFCHPELGQRETFSSRYLTEQIEKLGFRVEKPYCGFETAFRCELGDEEGPVVAFLAEYDALPGYGPGRDQNAHACGHNWIAAVTLAACAALAGVKQHFKGRIVYLGTPAEETLGSKITMADRGAFRDVDAAFQLHLAYDNCIRCRALAQADIGFFFEGLAAHASNAPEDGVNALDACQLTFAGINALRQHLAPDVKIHGIITEGGTACNIVPDHCSAAFYVRAGNKDYLEKVVEKVSNCARGAALMTGARLSIRREPNTFHDLNNDPALMELMETELRAQGICDFVEKDIYHCASTDMGNVSYACPTCYCELGTKEMGEARMHNQDFLKVVDSPLAYRLLHAGAKAMAAAALSVYCSGGTLRRPEEQE